MTFTNRRLTGLLILNHILCFIFNGVTAGALEDTFLEEISDYDGIVKTEFEFENPDQRKGDVVNTSPVSDKDFQCPPPYFLVMSECFYINVHHSLSWREARNFCKDMGGDLAEPSHHGALLAVVADKFPDGPQHFWLGASDLEEEGHFKWLSGRNVNTGWRHGQPDNAEEGEHCLDLWSSKYPAFSDKDCNQARTFICQHK